MANNKDICIALFSHANNEKKEKTLFESLKSIKKLGLDIILVSHIPVSERNQELCDYFVKDNNNMIIDESGIIQNVCDTKNVLFNATDYFGGYKFETYVFKKTYQAGVFNLYISSCKFAKTIGYKYIIFWEYDYILGPESIPFMKKNIDMMLIDDIDSISFNSVITISTNSTVLKEIYCTYGAPTFIKLDKLLSALPKKYIETSKEYVDSSELMIMEQWFTNKVISSCDKKIEYDLNEYGTLLPDTKPSTITSQNNYLFLNLKSGLYFNEKSCIVSFNNTSQSKLTINLIIYDNDNQNIFEKNIFLSPYTWSYDFLSDEIYDMLNSDFGCKIVETVKENDQSNPEIFEYFINKNNINHASELKKFSLVR